MLPDGVQCLVDRKLVIYKVVLDGSLSDKSRTVRTYRTLFLMQKK